MNEAASTTWARRIVVALVLAVPLVYGTAYRDYTLPPKLMLLQVGTLAGLVLACTAIKRARPPARTELPVIAAFIALSAASAIWATDPVPAVLVVAKLLTGFCLLLLVHAYPVSSLPTIARALTIAGVGIAALGILQHLGYRPLDAPSAGLPSATLGFRNIAAMVAIQTLPFACFLIADTERRTSRYAAVGAGLIAGFIILTRTRGAWLGSLVGLFIVLTLLLITRRDLLGHLWTRMTSLVYACLIAAAIASLPSGLGKTGPQSIDEKKSRVTDALTSVLDKGGDRGRITVWQNTLGMILDRPVAGVGAGNWAIAYPPYDEGETITFTNAPERPHNLALLILSELGIPGLILWLSILGLTLRAAWKALARRQHATPWLTLACVWSLVAILVHSCFSFPLERVTPLFYFWLVIAITLALGAEPARAIRRPRWLHAAIVVAATLPLMTYRLLEFERNVAHAIREELRGNWNAVAAHTASALRSGRFHPEAMHLYGYALNTTGHFEDAASFYEWVVLRRPHDVQILNGYAIALQNGGRHEEAESHFLSALRLVDAAPDLYYNLGGLYLQMRRFEDAVAAYETVRRLESDTPDLLFRLGNAISLAGRDAAAIEVLEQAKVLDPGRSDVYFVLGELYFRTRARHKAEQAFRNFLARAPGPSTYADVAKDRLESLPVAKP